jgi:translation initiation factor 4A
VVEDVWGSDRPDSPAESPERPYEGPPGMEPEGAIDSNWDEVCEGFDDMNLRYVRRGWSLFSGRKVKSMTYLSREELLRGIYAYGFERPSAIQQRAIVPSIKGLDMIAQAQSGTGKTATFSIAILQQVGRILLAHIINPTERLSLVRLD